VHNYWSATGRNPCSVTPPSATIDEHNPFQWKG